MVTQRYSDAINVFRDAYAVEFLDLPASHAEADLHRGLLDKLKNFLIELGRDFCFVGSEYPLQVGNRDFALDLLFFHRGLNCLVAIELKVSEFEPEFLAWISCMRLARRRFTDYRWLASRRKSIQTYWVFARHLSSVANHLFLNAPLPPNPYSTLRNISLSARRFPKIMS